MNNYEKLIGHKVTAPKGITVLLTAPEDNIKYERRILDESFTGEVIDTLPGNRVIIKALYGDLTIIVPVSKTTKEN